MSPIFTRTILVALSVFSLNLFTANSQTTYNNNGTNANYTLNNGDSLLINAGTYTGSITSNAGSVILVKSGANFNPSSLNNTFAKLVILGSATIANFSNKDGFVLENYGNTSFTGWVSFNDSPKALINHFGATLTFANSLAINNKADFEFTNKGNITIGGSLAFNSNANKVTFTNNKSIQVNGDLNFNITNSASTFVNQGRLQSTGNINLNGVTRISNTCRFASEGGINVNSNASIVNSGLIWLSNARNNSQITNNGTISLSGNGTIKSVRFTNYGTINGSGYLYFTGHTIGQGNFNGGTIYVNETSRTNSNPAYIFDVQYSNYSAIQYSNFAAPDTLTSPATCAPEEVPLPLPVKWESFNVNLSNNVPVLDWAATFDFDTNFEIQRSYDGINFTNIAVVMSMNGVNKYQYKDNHVSTTAKIVYYRINGKEITGESKLSDTRTVRFSNTKNVSLQIVPNPFVSQLQVQYQATENETISIRVINTGGQALVTKNVSVTKGFNSVAITEAGSFVKGVYFLQVISNNKIVATEKVVKQ